MPIRSITVYQPGEKKGGWVGRFVPGPQKPKDVARPEEETPVESPDDESGRPEGAR